MKELVDGGGHPDGEVDPPLVLLDRVCCTFLLGLCADRLSLDEGRTLAIWIKDRGNELGSCWVSLSFPYVHLSLRNVVWG